MGGGLWLIWRCAIKILLVAPDLVGVDAINEARRIQQYHDVVTLYGTVTVDDVYRAVQEKSFDVLHFATHGGPDGVQLSGGVVLDAETIAQFLRLRESAGLFLSSCDTGKIASYAVQHGAVWAISSEVPLPDADAWKLPAAFYGALRNGHSRDIVGAFILADGGDGKYGLRWNPLYIQELQRAAALAASIPHTARPLSRQEAAILAVLLTLGAAGLTAALLFAAGRL